MKRGINSYVRKRHSDYIKSLNWCFYCQSNILQVHIEHIKPLHYGGDSDISNLTGSCGRCNSYKSTFNLSEFKKRMEFNRDRILNKLYGNTHRLRRIKAKGGSDYEKEFYSKRISKLRIDHSYFTSIINSIETEKYKLNV